MNTMTAGRCNVYYHSVKGGVTFHSTQAFSPKPEAALWPFLMHFEHVGNQKYCTPVAGGSKSRHGTHRNWKRKCNTWQ